MLVLAAASLSRTFHFDVLVVVPCNSTTDDGTSISKSSVLRQSWQESEEILASAHQALQDLNQQCFPFRLSVTQLRTDCRQAQVSLMEMVRELTTPDRTTVAVAGVFCRAILDKLLGITKHQRLGVVRIALNPFLPETNKELQNYYYQVFPSSLGYAELLAQFMQHVGWTHVAVVTLGDGTSFYFKMAEQVVAILTHRGIKAVKVTSTDSMEQTVRTVHATGLIQVYVLLPPAETVGLICGAYDYGLRWPAYGWLVPDISLEEVSSAAINSEHCDPQATKGIVSFQTAKTSTESVSTPNTNTCSSNQLSTRQKRSQVAVDNIYARAMYDWVQTIYLATNNTFPKIRQYLETYSPTEGTHTHLSKLTAQRRISELVGNTLKNNSFSGNTIFHSITTYQILNSSLHKLSVYNSHGNVTLFENSSTFSLPTETLKRVYRVLPGHVDTILTTGLAACVLFILVNMCLYVYYRKAPEMKASSVGISMMIYISCYVICAGCALDLKTSTYIVTHNWVCTGILWAIHPWNDLILATLLVQIGRIYHIFSQFRRITKLATDRNLLVVIFLIVLGKILILSLWTALDRFVIVDVEVYHPEGKPPYYEVIQECHSDHFIIWISVTIVYSGILIAFVAFVSYKTRKVHRKDFKNTKKVNVSLSVVVITMAVLLPLWWVFRSLENSVMSRVTIVSLYLTIPMTCQACLFCPKTLPPLQRSVSRCVYKKKHLRRERSRTMERVVFLQKPDPSQLSLSLQHQSIY